MSQTPHLLELVRRDAAIQWKDKLIIHHRRFAKKKSSISRRGTTLASTFILYHKKMKEIDTYIIIH